MRHLHFFTGLAEFGSGFRGGPLSWECGVARQVGTCHDGVPGKPSTYCVLPNFSPCSSSRWLRKRTCLGILKALAGLNQLPGRGELERRAPKSRANDAVSMGCGAVLGPLASHTAGDRVCWLGKFSQGTPQRAAPLVSQAHLLEGWGDSQPVHIAPNPLPRPCRWRSRIVLEDLDTAGIRHFHLPPQALSSVRSYQALRTKDWTQCGKSGAGQVTKQSQDQGVPSDQQPFRTSPLGNELQGPELCPLPWKRSMTWVCPSQASWR